MTLCPPTNHPQMQLTRKMVQLLSPKMALLLFATLSAFTLTYRPAVCDRFFMSHLASVPPLASYFMSTFPGSFSSTPAGQLGGHSSTSSVSVPVALPYLGGHAPYGAMECEYNGNHIMDYILERVRKHLPGREIVIPNGAITIYDASITRFAELARLRPSCLRKLDPAGLRLELPFEAEIRLAHVSAKLKYNFYVTDIYGDYSGNFSHIRMNGTFEADLLEERLAITNFTITSSQVVADSIVFGYVPKWILDWVRSYFDTDNTKLYQDLAKPILVEEAEIFRHFDMFREAMSAPAMQGREEEERMPLNRL